MLHTLPSLFIRTASASRTVWPIKCFLFALARAMSISQVSVYINVYIYIYVLDTMLNKIAIIHGCRTEVARTFVRNQYMNCEFIDHRVAYLCGV